MKSQNVEKSSYSSYSKTMRLHHEFVIIDNISNFVFEHLDTHAPSEYTEKGYYETLTISKEKMCGKIHDLINLFSKAKNEKKCIMHCGV